MKRYRSLREALDEYEEAVAYYESRRTGLGETFVHEVDHVIALMQEHPEMGAPVADTPPELGIRRQLVRRFGVEIDYLISDDVIGHPRRVSRPATAGLLEEAAPAASMSCQLPAIQVSSFGSRFRSVRRTSGRAVSTRSA